MPQDNREPFGKMYQSAEDGGTVFIPARPRAGLGDQARILRVCAYCRVSTGNDEQLSSFELQQAHYKQLAKDKPNWDLKHIYADAGISGTSLKNRDAFNAMIAACENGEYDLIVTKQVSRFARNLVDCISLIRKLKNLEPPVGVLFETDNLNTLDKDSEFILAFLASFAQEESIKKREAMIWSLAQRFKDRRLLTPPLLGYDRQRDAAGSYIKYAPLIVNEDEARVVRFIFDAYLYGWTQADIAAFLTGIDCRTKTGSTKWNSSSIGYILSNASAKIGLRQKSLQQEGTGLVLFDFSARRLQMKKTTKVIAVCNQKGGVGKTVTTVNLGIGLARQGKRVLLVDVDPQGSLTASLGYHQPDRIETTLSTVLGKIVQQKPFDPAGYILHQEEGVDLLPANIDLAMVEMNLVGVMGRETVLREFLETVRRQYDYILLDCCPSLGTLTANALTAADEVIIPMLAHYLSIKGLEQLLATIGLVRRKFNPSLQISGILITMANMRTAYSRDIVALLRGNYGNKLRIFDTIIPESIRAAETSAEGKSIYLHDPSGKVSTAYNAFTLEVAS
ncbi:AAA family ATPase [Acutalibacter sp. JLR.KK004]|uniref:AAA family ATPase n=1 Tax=Acutalibacter sp. JLR.KK004 TaxID=3112622 RepID=UPI002FF16BEA